MYKVLVIEDEIDIRANLVEMMTLEHYQVYESANGEEGIAMARQVQPDVILCDIIMPKADGFQVLFELRNDRPTATIPFIFLTALADRSSNRHGMRLGADDYITKPFSAGEVMDAIRTQLTKRNQIAQEYEERLETLRRNIIHVLPHEMRTPLAGIIGCAEFLSMEGEKIEPERVRHISQIVERSARRLERMIENYLLYAQIEIISSDPARLSELQQSRLLDTGNLIYETAIKRAEMYQRARDLRLELNSAVIGVSEENFSKIIDELLDNAFKFSEIGTPVMLEAEITPDRQYHLSISDRGRGMTQDEIKSIGAYIQFERTLYEQQGIGMGLTIAYRLTKIHGGAFDIDSTVQRGTTVHLSFPIME